MSVMQVLVVSGILFILYRFLLMTIGVELLGVWSVVLATTSVVNMANFGLSASVVKFVAKYLAHDEKETVSKVIQTSAISLSIVIGLILLIVYPLAGWLLTFIIPPSAIEAALTILPYALLSLWIAIISGVYQAGIDGLQRIDIRSIVIMSGAVLNLILCILLVPSFGLTGLAYAYVAQNAFIFIGSLLILKAYLISLPLVPYQWNRTLFTEMVKYGLNFQAITISQMLCDPLTKALLTKFGGLGMTGFYEMASRMILQFRALIVSANQVIVPAIAHLQEKNPGVIQTVYNDSYRLILYIAIPYFSAIIAFAPIVSIAWIGYYENIFVFFFIVLAIGWFLNTLVGPAYFVNLGTGKLGWNTVGHVIMALLNLGLGLLLGYTYGGKAVVVAWVLSLVAGSLIIVVSYHHKNDVPISGILPKEYIGIGSASLVGATISLLLYRLLNNSLNFLSLSGVIVMTIFMMTVLPVWLHPMRKRLTGWVKSGLSRES